MSKVRRVAIVGAAQTQHEEEKAGLRPNDVAFGPIEKVLQQTGLTYSDRVKDGFGVEKILTTMEDHFVGNTCTSLQVHHYMGAFGLAHDNVSADGTFAVYHAVIDIMSGHYDTIMVVSTTKESDAHRPSIENCYFDHIFLQPLGFDYLSASALQAQRYMEKYGISEEQCARVAVRNRLNAKNNPYAQEPLSITVDDVMNSNMLASPIRRLHSRPNISDGACALILTTEEKALKISDNPVWVKGIGNCFDSHYLGDRDLADCISLKKAAERAYAMAGINDPVGEIDVAEISEEYSYQELLWSEGLGFCGPGEGGKYMEKGKSEMTGELPINPSGGILAGNPLQVAGSVRVAEAVSQLRGEAGDRQIEGAKVALAHGFTGACGQSHCVLILGN